MRTAPGGGFKSAERLADEQAYRQNLRDASARAVASETGLTPEQVMAYNSGDKSDPMVAAKMANWNSQSANPWGLPQALASAAGNTVQGLGGAASGKHGAIPQLALALMAYNAIPAMGTAGTTAATDAGTMSGATEAAPYVSATQGVSSLPVTNAITGATTPLAMNAAGTTGGSGMFGDLFKGMNASDYMGLLTSGVGLASALTGRPSTQTQTSYVNDVSAPWEQGGARGDLARALMARLGSSNDYWNSQSGLGNVAGMGATSNLLKALLDAQAHPRSAVSVYDPKYIAAHPLAPVQSGMPIVNGQTPSGSLLANALARKV